MYSSTELGAVTDTLVSVLQYKDLSEREGRENAAQPKTQAKAGADKGERSGAPKAQGISAAEIALLVEREKTNAVLQTEERLRKEYEQKLVSERASLAKLVADFGEERGDYYARVEAEVVQLALSIAAKILHREAQVDPMLVATLVRIAVEKMRDGSGVTLRVNPSRAESWRRYFAEYPNLSHVEVTEDASLNEQDCIVGTELGSANFGLDTQLKEVEQGFFDLLALRPAAR
jgi:flagellar assembly protein FliH